MNNEYIQLFEAALDNYPQTTSPTIQQQRVEEEGYRVINQAMLDLSSLKEPLPVSEITIAEKARNILANNATRIEGVQLLECSRITQAEHINNLSASGDRILDIKFVEQLNLGIKVLITHTQLTHVELMEKASEIAERELNREYQRDTNHYTARLEQVKMLKTHVMKTYNALKGGFKAQIDALMS
ncbi:hypothetical protein [Mangrovibacter yixingensis]|uniref:hypothetical protein n=1 Tax=Mangrovibacter yixingensis TaxID=1529639 RepID=UPI001CFD3198|nr:hypothetical protein [Mangrovibacter yixingensis]